MDQRSTSWRTTTALAATSASEPELPRTQPRCKLCSAPEKDVSNGAAVVNLVDDLLCIPRSYASIMRTVAPLIADWPEEARFSKFSLMRHARRHLRFEQAAFRGMADHRRRDVERLGRGSQRMLDAGVLLAAVEQRGLDLLLQDEIRPTVRDAMAASTALRDLENEAQATISPEDVLVQVEAIVQAIRYEVPAEYHPAVIARIEGYQRSWDTRSEDLTWREFMAEIDDQGSR
jgi:hypothetical protein